MTTAAHHFPLVHCMHQPHESNLQAFVQCLSEGVAECLYRSLLCKYLFSSILRCVFKGLSCVMLGAMGGHNLQHHLVREFAVTTAAHHVPLMHCMHQPHEANLQAFVQCLSDGFAQCLYRSLLCKSLFNLILTGVYTGLSCVILGVMGRHNLQHHLV